MALDLCTTRRDSPRLDRGPVTGEEVNDPSAAGRHELKPVRTMCTLSPLAG